MSSRANMGRTADIAALTPAESAALAAMARSGSFAGAARELGVTAKSVENRFDAIRQKLGAASLREAVALRRGQGA